MCASRSCLRAHPKPRDRERVYELLRDGKVQVERFLNHSRSAHLKGAFFYLPLSLFLKKIPGIISSSRNIAQERSRPGSRSSSTRSCDLFSEWERLVMPIPTKLDWSETDLTWRPYHLHILATQPKTHHTKQDPTQW